MFSTYVQFCTIVALVGVHVHVVSWEKGKEQKRVRFESLLCGGAPSWDFEKETSFSNFLRLFFRNLGLSLNLEIITESMNGNID